MMYRWYKTLSHADAQHPEGEGTNPTGHLTLVQARHPINSSLWFREVFFEGLPWRGGGEKERVSVDFSVAVRGRALGVYALDVSHTPSFEANQGNRTTVLHWGELSPVMHALDYSGSVVTLERDFDGSFYLNIDESARGSFKG